MTLLRTKTPFSCPLGVGLLLGVLLAIPLALAQEPSQDLELITVEPQVLNPTVSVGGTVSAHKTVSLTAQVPGRVEYIAGREGDQFHAGDVLIKIDDSALRAQLEAARAQEASAAAALRNAGVQLNREIASPSVASSTPGGMGLPSMMDQMFTNPMQNMMGTRRPQTERRADVYARQSSVEQARSAYMQAQSRIREIQAHLRDTTALAPFDGVVVHKYIEKGDTVQPGQPLLDFADTHALKIEVDVPARLRPSLREGMAVPVHISSVATPLTATLTRIFPVADPSRHTVHVELALPEHERVSPGMYAEVMVPDTAVASQVIAIPERAVVRRGGLTQVFVVNRDHRAVLRLVRTGERVAGDKVEILAGLRGGERIVVNPPPGLRSGTPIGPPAG